MGLFATIKRSAKECGLPRVLQVGGFAAELFPQPCFQAKTARYAENPRDPYARQAVLEHLQPQARRSAKAMAAQKLSPEGWPRIRRTFFGDMSRSTPLPVASEVCARHLVGESRPAPSRSRLT